MTRPEEILKKVRVASPCPANWDHMEGDDRVRYCSLCRLNVYNLSDMPAGDAARLVSEREGRLCVRYFQRRDGSVLTRDCPVGIRAIRKRMANSFACAIVLMLSGLAYASNLGRRDSNSCESGSLIKDARARLGNVEPFRSVLDWIDPPKPAPINATTGRVVVGVMAPTWWPNHPPSNGSGGIRP